MYNGRGLGRKGIGTGRRSSVGSRRHFEGFKDVSRDVRDFKKASKGCPMTITLPSRSQRLDAMRAPGWGSICGGEADAFEAEAIDQARGTRVRAMELGDSVGSVEVSGGFP